MLEVTPYINRNMGANQLTHTRSKRTYDISGNAESRPESVPLEEREKRICESTLCVYGRFAFTCHYKNYARR